MNCLILFSVELFTNTLCTEIKSLIWTEQYIYFFNTVLCLCYSSLWPSFFSLSNTIFSRLTAVFWRLALSAALRSGHAGPAPGVALCTAPGVLRPAQTHPGTGRDHRHSGGSRALSYSHWGFLLYYYFTIAVVVFVFNIIITIDKTHSTHTYKHFVR